MNKYILLLRHGKTDKEASDEDEKRPLSTEGKKAIKEVANKLAEHLSLLPSAERIVIGEIWHGNYRQVNETKELVYEQLLNAGLVTPTLPQRPKETLNPKQFLQDRTEAERQAIGKQLLDQLSCLPLLDTLPPSEPHAPNAIMVVGHAPQLGWIAETILQKPFPIHRGELLCLAIKERAYDSVSPPRAHVLWSLAPTDEGAMKEIKQKIKSKMDLAGILGGLIIGVLGLSLLDVNTFSSNLDTLNNYHQVALYGAAILLLVSLALYFATLYAYDRLLMPTRFWAEKAGSRPRRWLVYRPPSSSLMILYQNMLRIWNRLFMPATYAVIFGLFFLLIAMLQLSGMGVLVLISVAIVVFLYILLHQPVLGVED